MNPRKWIPLLLLATASTLFAIAAVPPQAPAWKPLFNGKDLTGWKHVGPGNMTVEDGLIRTHGGMGLLYWTGGKLSNCRIRVVYKMRDVTDTDYTEGQPVPERKFNFEPQHGARPNEGYIGLQNHSDNDIVFFKEVSVQPLK